MKTLILVILTALALSSCGKSKAMEKECVAGISGGRAFHYHLSILEDGVSTVMCQIDSGEIKYGSYQFEEDGQKYNYRCISIDDVWTARRTTDTAVVVTDGSFEVEMSCN